MRLRDRILVQLTSTYDGNAWHGTSLRKLLRGIDNTKAHARSMPNAHTIAELVAHIASWIEIATQRARGERAGVSAKRNFPDVDGVPFAAVVARLDRAHAQLVDAVSSMTDAQLAATVPGKKYPNDFMLFGVAHHNTYHAGQIALLKKAQSPK